MPSASRPNDVQMFQKGYVKPFFAGTTMSQDFPEMSDTEFEEDFSDIEEYSGRRSEESVCQLPFPGGRSLTLFQFGKQSDTSVSTFEELRTPNSHEFKDFRFQLPEEIVPPKPVEGPVGPHLFRISQETSQDVDFYLSMSPAASPQSQRAGPIATTHIYLQPEPAKVPLSSIPLRIWTSPQVIEWMVGVGFEDSLVEKFRSNDISGAILEDLQFGDLKELGVHSFGQRHRLWNEIRSLRGSALDASPVNRTEDGCRSPNGAQQSPVRAECSPDCSNPATPEAENGRSPAVGLRRARRARRPDDDIISPAESASIVAIEQLLPKPHHCSKGENCSKWQKQQRKLAKIAKEFPLELQQIGQANASPTETTLRPASEAVPSVVASSDLLGPGAYPALRLDEQHLKVVQSRDPQENVRQFLSFQHVASPEEPTTPPTKCFHRSRHRAKHKHPTGI